jgi:hypothetical protein
MSRVVYILLAVSMAAFMTWPAVADRKGHGSYHEQSGRKSDDGYKDNRHRNDRNRDMDHHRERDRDRDRQRDRDRGWDDDYRKPGHHPHGYRTQPHGRQYKHSHMRKGHTYHYDGHWNSWGAWEGYRKRHPERFHQGGYYRESGHLYYRFCDPVGTACFFFSIGR